MPLGPFSKLRRPVWPNPEDSCGIKLGETPKKGVFYWKATGPASEAYQELLPDIRKVLAEKQGPIPDSDIVGFNIYMIGTDIFTAIPIIMFTSENRRERRKAMKYIRESKILDKHLGIDAGEWQEAPHIGVQEQRGSWGDNSCEIPVESTVAEIESFHAAGSQVSAVLRFDYPDGPVRATASVEVSIFDKRHYLVPSHVLVTKLPKNPSETPDESDYEGFDFGSLTSEEAEDESLTTSLASVSSLDSGSQHTDQQLVDDESAESTPIDETRFTGPRLSHDNTQRSDRNPDDPARANCPVLSMDMDYALCRVQNDPPIPLPDLLSIPIIDVQSDDTGSQVQVLTAHGKLLGRLSRDGTHVRLPGSTSFREVYVAHFESTVLAGDCGAMVYDTSGKNVFGHLITGSTSTTLNSAFVVPIQQSRNAILQRLIPLSTAKADSSKHKESVDASVTPDSVIAGSEESSAKPSAESDTSETHETVKKEGIGRLKNLLTGSSSLFRPKSSAPTSKSTVSSEVDTPSLTEPPTPSAPQPRRGLTVIHAPQVGHNVDIVFVHGLGGDSIRTWTKGGDPETFWPSLFLPRERGLDRARILTFGYDSKFQDNGPSGLSILDHAKNLLFCLKYDKGTRSDDLHIGQVPLIFVAHSVGGLVVKEAYVQGKNDPSYKDIIKAISGITFLATPHRGTQLAEVLSRILATSLQSPRRYIADMASKSDALHRVNEQFRHYAASLSIVSFYETQPMNTGPRNMLVAERDSAVLGYPGEIVQPLHANHRDICKFRSPEDVNYQSVSSVLQDFVARATKNKTTSEDLLQSEGNSLERLASLTGISEVPDEDYNFFRDKWTGGTNEWILQNKQFLDWRDSRHPKHRILWLNGAPGTGKSVLASSIINHLVTEGLSCQYFFIRFGNRGKRSLSLLLRSLAYQMARTNPEFLEQIIGLRSEGIDFASADVRTIWERLFRSILFKMTGMPPLFWVVDALDEAENPRAVAKMLSDITSSSVPIRILVTGRKDRKTDAAFQQKREGLVFQEISLGDRDHGDICQYIRESLDAEILGSNGAVEQQIVERSQGNFLWTSLVVQEINKCHSVSQIEDVLDELPTGMEALYGRIASSLVDRDRDTPLALIVLECIVASQRLLRVPELIHAVEDAGYKLIAPEKRIVEICSGFVVFDEDGNVALAHQSVRDYLLRPDVPGQESQPLRVDRAAANKRMFLGCMRSLMTPGVAAVPSRQIPSPLFDYAIRFWSSHLHQSSSDDEEIVDMLGKFVNGLSILSWIHALATEDQLRILIRASKDLATYATRRRKKYPLQPEAAFKRQESFEA